MSLMREPAAEVDVVHHLVAADLVRRAFDDLLAVVHHRHVLRRRAARCPCRARSGSASRPAGSESSSSVSRSRSPRESPEAGSSSIISFGSVALAMPTSSWRCWPCESEPTSVCSESPSHTRSAAARARSRCVLLARGRLDDAQPAAVVPHDGEVEVVLDRQAREEPRLLVRPGDAEPRAHARGEVGDVGAHHVDRAGRRHEVTGDQVEQGRLARAVRAQDGAALAVRDVEIDVAHGLHPAETPADPPQAEDRTGGFGSDGGRRFSQRMSFTAD